MADQPLVRGDFHVIRMDGLFHVVFRPDDDPEWFRIIATFFTYERAWSYCDIERVSVWSYTNADCVDEPESHTGEEEAAGLRAPPLAETIPEGWMASSDGCAELVRSIMDDAAAAVVPHPVEDFSDHPHEQEKPKAYRDRLYAEAIAKAADAPEPPVPALIEAPPSELSTNQRAVLSLFESRANNLRLVNITHRQIADEVGVARSGVSQVIEALVRKGLVEVREKGGLETSGVFLLRDPATPLANFDGLTCRSCGGPRSPGSAGQCRACYLNPPVTATTQ